MKNILHHTRRSILTLSGVAILNGLAGCSNLSSESGDLGLTIFNNSDISYTVDIDIFDVGDDVSRSGSSVYEDSIDIEPQEDTHRENVAEISPYIIMYDVYENNNSLTDQDHIHYYPSSDSDDENLLLNINQSGEITQRKVF